MCLFASKATIRNAEKRRKTSGYTYAWKVVRKNWAGLKSQHRHFIWDAGWNMSDRDTVELCDIEKDNFLTYLDCAIHHGIHVYLRKKDAERYCNGFNVVIRVKCYNKDLVARSGSMRATKQAVYTKVFLARDEYDNAMKSKA